MNFYVGQKEIELCAFSTSDVLKFSELSGDKNPIHLNSEYARLTIFKKPIVHGFLYASKISKLIANKLPGPGSVYINQELNFLTPVYHNEEIIITIEIIEIRIEKQIFILSTVIEKHDGQIVLKGKAVIKLMSNE